MPVKTTKSLFSEHYLTRRLPEHAEWREPAAVGAYEAAVALYRAKVDVLPRMNEAQTEQEFIQPLLDDVLGFGGAYSVQAAVKQQGQVQRAPAQAASPRRYGRAVAKVLRQLSTRCRSQD